MNTGSINNNFDKNNTSRENLILGIVRTIRGSIVEAQFEKNLRSINSVIRVGNKLEIIIEVQLQPNTKHIRGIALTPTLGLARGMKAETTNEPLRISDCQNNGGFV